MHDTKHLQCPLLHHNIHVGMCQFNPAHCNCAYCVLIGIWRSPFCLIASIVMQVHDGMAWGLQSQAVKVAELQRQNVSLATQLQRQLGPSSSALNGGGGLGALGDMDASRELLSSTPPAGGGDSPIGMEVDEPKPMSRSQPGDNAALRLLPSQFVFDAMSIHPSFTAEQLCALYEMFVRHSSNMASHVPAGPLGFSTLGMQQVGPPR